MKTLVYLVGVCVLSVGTAWADQLRIREKKGSDTFDVAYAKVRLLSGNKSSFEGWTDKYGRITVNVPNGAYTAEVCRGSTTNRVAVAIDGKDTVKIVQFGNP